MLLSRHFHFGLLSLSLSLSLLAGLAPVGASPLDTPSGPVLLRVTGDISATNAGEEAAFDRAMLEALDWVEVETHTSFTSGAQVFAGPTLASLLEAVGAQGTSLQASAVNDYTVHIPAAHAIAHDVILAMDMNGKRMRVRDKGPIWVVYPLSSAAAETRLFDEQMIWQLVRIRIE